MKPANNFKSSILLPVFLIVSLIIPSCESMKEDPAYVATWEYKDKIYLGDLTLNTTRTLTLTKTSYTEVYVVRRDNSSIVLSIIGLKGDISVKGNKMTFTLMELGECVRDTEDKCTSAVKWYGPETQFYKDNIKLFSQTIVAEFEADENYLWLVRDLNGDGDTEDNGEEIEFKRI
ncbi:MAG: hypothetical protein GT598_11780 [Bacteroidales bacterium]|nr:hypothetical protein [Bacteroidales bacterium]OQB58955.1 MAG: hypothetical protein BWX96_02919 [Bacteroidetes bacterium ADurb.Bin145]